MHFLRSSCTKSLCALFIQNSQLLLRFTMLTYYVARWYSNERHNCRFEVKYSCKYHFRWEFRKLKVICRHNSFYALPVIVRVIICFRLVFALTIEVWSVITQPGTVFVINLRLLVIARRKLVSYDMNNLFSYHADEDYNLDSSAQHYKEKCEIVNQHNVQKICVWLCLTWLSFDIFQIIVSYKSHFML